MQVPIFGGTPCISFNNSRRTICTQLATQFLVWSMVYRSVYTQTALGGFLFSRSIYRLDTFNFVDTMSFSWRRIHKFIYLIDLIKQSNRRCQAKFLNSWVRNSGVSQFGYIIRSSLLDYALKTGYSHLILRMGSAHNKCGPHGDYQV